MSKESYAGQDCKCGQRIAFMEQHWPHCLLNPDNLTGATKSEGAKNKAKAKHGQ